MAAKQRTGRMSVLLPRDLIFRLRNEANLRGVAPSAFVRELLKLAFKQRGTWQEKVKWALVQPRYRRRVLKAGRTR